MQTRLLPLLALPVISGCSSPPHSVVGDPIPANVALIQKGHVIRVFEDIAKEVKGDVGATYALSNLRAQWAKAQTLKELRYFLNFLPTKIGDVSVRGTNSQKVRQLCAKLEQAVMAHYRQCERWEFFNRTPQRLD